METWFTLFIFNKPAPVTEVNRERVEMEEGEDKFQGSGFSKSQDNNCMSFMSLELHLIAQLYGLRAHTALLSPSQAEK